MVDFTERWTSMYFIHPFVTGSELNNLLDRRDVFPLLITGKLITVRILLLITADNYTT